MKHAAKWFALAMVMILLLAGCSSGGGQQQTPADQPGGGVAAGTVSDTLTYGVGVDARTMDPQMVDNVPTANAVMHVHETLVTWDKNMDIVGRLAESWETSPDGKTWTFKLREGIKFHDGADFNAEAVKKSFERILDPDLGSPRRSILSMITDMEIVDPYTIALTTEEPFGPFLSQLATYNAAILSPKAIDEYGKDYATHPAGTGPYVLKDWLPGEKMVFERFEDYWGEKPPTKTIVFKVIPENTTRVMALQTGEVDIISNVPPFQIEQLEKAPNLQVDLIPGFRTIYLGMNFKNKPFDDVRVRQALNHAIDRQAIIDNILLGTAEIAIGPEATSIPGASKDLPTYDYDPEKAKQLLAEAGYPNGLEIKFHAPFGRYNMDKQVAEAIQAQLAQVGIKADLQTLDWSIYSDMLKKGEETQLFMVGKGSPAGDLDFTAQICWVTGGSLNYSFMSDPEIDALVAEQRRTVDQEKRLEVLQKMQEKIQEQLPWASLYYEKQIVAKNKSVSGEFIWPNEFVDLRYAKKQ
ncbi:MAG: glutathione ABC transporter substrate-binding protein [Firmicutes bacterium]|jgi:peptide/nickel transport system substrate-binding protein|nr:glutathione ABC transporter substrate-binding protein [Bacillota bacterium]